MLEGKKKIANAVKRKSMDAVDGRAKSNARESLRRRNRAARTDTSAVTPLPLRDRAMRNETILRRGILRETWERHFL